MTKSGRHSKRRGGLMDTTRGVKQSQVRKKGAIMSLVTAKLAGVDIPLGNMRSKSVTRQFKARQNKK